MPRERFYPKNGWVSHEEIIKNMEDKKKAGGSLTDSEKADLARLKEFNGDRKENKKPGSSIVKL